MLTEIDKDMMLKFLEKNYPISRVKDKNKFRRAIVLETGTFILGNESNHIQLRLRLIEVVKTVFSCDHATAIAVLNNFLNLK